MGIWFWLVVGWDCCWPRPFSGSGRAQRGRAGRLAGRFGHLTPTRHLVAIRHHLPDLPPLLPGQQQRRHWRPERHSPPPRLHRKSGRAGRLAFPIYPSPMHDFGYDVADYTWHSPDVRQRWPILTPCWPTSTSRGLKLILDLVPNHTSDEHPWFVESRSSRDNPKRDWYIWADPAPDGGPPNNWLSYFGGPAWTFDERPANITCTNLSPSSRN
jgi:hypothetical protein